MSSADSDTSVLGALKDIATGALDRSTAVNPEICAAVDTDSEGTNLDREGLVGATTRSVTGGLSDLKGAAVPTPEDRGDQLGQQKFRRREFVAGIGTATAAGLAGCGGSSNEERGSENGDVTEAPESETQTESEIGGNDDRDDVGDVETAEEQPDRTEHPDAQDPAGENTWATVSYSDIGEDSIRLTHGDGVVYPLAYGAKKEGPQEQKVPIDERPRMLVAQTTSGEDDFVAIAAAGEEANPDNLPIERLTDSGKLRGEDGVLVVAGQYAGSGPGVATFVGEGDQIEMTEDGVSPSALSDVDVEMATPSEIVQGYSREENQQDVSGVAVES